MLNVEVAQDHGADDGADEQVTQQKRLVPVGSLHIGQSRVAADQIGRLAQGRGHQQYQAKAGHAGTAVSEPVQPGAQDTHQGRTGEGDPLHEQGYETQIAPAALGLSLRRQRQDEGEQFGNDDDDEDGADITEIRQECFRDAGIVMGQSGAGGFHGTGNSRALRWFLSAMPGKSSGQQGGASFHKGGKV